MLRRFLSAAPQTGRKVKVLITGAHGQLGSELCESIHSRFGAGSVMLTDVRRKDTLPPYAAFHHLDVTDKTTFSRLVVENGVTHIVHYAALLSAVGERNVEKALEINIRGAEIALEVARDHGCTIFIPSSIAAFGPTTPRVLTTNLTIQRPTTIYGVSKVYAELLGEYFHIRYGTDFRSLRYPGIISYKVAPGGGTTDWSCAMFYAALSPQRSYECFVRSDTRMPLMYMPDCLDATMDFLFADSARLSSSRTYNVAGLSFTPADLAAEIRKQGASDLKVTYNPDMRQRIADSWPESLDDKEARKDWGWKPKCDLPFLVRDMMKNLTEMRDQNRLPAA